MGLTTEEIKGKKAKRITADYGIHDVYTYYVSITNESFRLPPSTVKSIIRDLNSALVKKLLSGPVSLRLLCRCGDLRIKKTKMTFSDTNSLRIDWARTKKANKKVYHLNEHRGGYRYRFLWSKPRLANITAYSFRPTRTNKRTLAHILHTNKDLDFSE